MSAAKLWDELWVEVKCQTNLDIAGSPRNSSRASVKGSVAEVEHWIGRGGRKLAGPNQTPNAATPHLGSRTVGDKLHCREGNSPDRRLRSSSPG